MYILRGGGKVTVETDDPLLEGPVPASVGAEINTRDQLSADDPTTTVTRGRA